jgi:hypothetical protein
LLRVEGCRPGVQLWFRVSTRSICCMNCHASFRDCSMRVTKAWFCAAFLAAASIDNCLLRLSRNSCCRKCCCCCRVYGLVLPPLDAALEAVKSHLGPGQGLDAVKVATSMANRCMQMYNKTLTYTWGRLLWSWCAFLVLHVVCWPSCVSSAAT